MFSRYLLIALFSLYVVTGCAGGNAPSEAIDANEANFSQDICSDSVDKIKTLINTASYCEKDSDCEFMPIACSMGCPVVNKKYVQEIKDVIASRDSCMCTMEACAPVTKVGCVQGICKAL